MTLRSAHDMPVQNQRRDGGLAPTHSQPGARERWVASIRLRTLYPRGKTQYQEAGWALVPVCVDFPEALTLLPRNCISTSITLIKLHKEMSVL